MGLGRKELRILIASLEKQGAKVREGTGGKFIIKPPNGSEPFVIHGSTSDRRAGLNYRALVRRAGLIYPGDK